MDKVHCEDCIYSLSINSWPSEEHIWWWWWCCWWTQQACIKLGSEIASPLSWKFCQRLTIYLVAYPLVHTTWSEAPNWETGALIIIICSSRSIISSIMSPAIIIMQTVYFGSGWCWARDKGTRLLLINHFDNLIGSYIRLIPHIVDDPVSRRRGSFIVPMRYTFFLYFGD